MSNLDDLRDRVAEAREALRRVDPPTPERDNPLYYPLLFLAETADAVVRRASIPRPRKARPVEGTPEAIARDNATPATTQTKRPR